MRFKKNPNADTVDAIQLSECLTISSGTKQCHVNKGDWLAIDGIGMLRIYTDETFKKAFIQVEESWH